MICVWKTGLIGAAFAVVATFAPAAEQEAADGQTDLHALAAQAGLVRVIVELAQGGETGVDTAKMVLQTALPMDDAPLVEPIDDQPFVVMEVSHRGLQWLAASPLVAQISADGLTGVDPIRPGDPRESVDGQDPGPSHGGGGSNELSAPQN